MGSGCRANCGRFEAGTTVDLRIGFNGVSMSVEPRLTFSYVSLGGGHTLIFTPDVNFLKPMGTSTSHKGLYLTAGAGISFISASGEASENPFSLNGGGGPPVPETDNKWRMGGVFPSH